MNSWIYIIGIIRKFATIAETTLAEVGTAPDRPYISSQTCR